MICPNTAEFIIRDAEWYTSPSISCCVIPSAAIFLRSCSRWSTASTIITAPSTMSPKSKAPRLIRFPETPKMFIMIMAKSIASGITEATNSPARKFPRKSTSTKTTISAPSNRFFSTVPMALFTILVRSKKASIFTPSGSVFWISVMRSFTFWITSFELAPFIIITTAPATSPSPL